LFNACLVLYDMTGGYVNIFEDPLMKNMGEYAVKVVVTEDRVLNFADSSSRTSPNPMLLYHWGKACGSEMMTEFGRWRLGGELMSVSADTSLSYRFMRFLTTCRLEKAELTVPEKIYIGGLEVAAIREYPELSRGLYVALKGGNNNESHNHNDLGNIIVFADGKPIFIDAGSGKYTRKTFSSERYTIWAMCSDYHNCLTFNGVTQRAGADFRSTDTVYDELSGKMTLDLTHAYPAEAGLSSYKRSAELTDGKVIITDEVLFEEEGTVMCSLIVREDPSEVGEGFFVLAGRRVEFDSSLTYSIELLDSSEPEVAAIPGGWRTDALRRITLTEKAPVRGKVYRLTVS